MGKLYPGADEALAGLLFEGMTIAAGGFGLCGIPERLIDAVRDSGVTGLTCISKSSSWSMSPAMATRSSFPNARCR